MGEGFFINTMGGGGPGIKWNKSKRSSRKSVTTKIKQRRRQNKHRKRLIKASKMESVTKRYERKDPGIPNKWPLKEEMLNAIADKREHEKAVREEAKRERLKLAHLDSSDDDDNVVPDLVTDVDM